MRDGGWGRRAVVTGSVAAGLAGTASVAPAAEFDFFQQGMDGTPEQALEYLETMKKQKRYQRDVY